MRWSLANTVGFAVAVLAVAAAVVGIATSYLLPEYAIRRGFIYSRTLPIIQYHDREYAPPEDNPADGSACWESTHKPPSWPPLTASGTVARWRGAPAEFRSPAGTTPTLLLLDFDPACSIVYSLLGSP